MADLLDRYGGAEDKRQTQRDQDGGSGDLPRRRNDPGGQQQQQQQQQTRREPDRQDGDLLDRYGGAEDRQQQDDYGYLDALERGARGVGLATDALGDYFLGRPARAAGQALEDAGWESNPLSAAGEASQDRLARMYTGYEGSGDPALADAGQAINQAYEEDGVLSAIGQTGSELAEDPQMISRLLTEQIPSLAVGGPAGGMAARGAMKSVVPRLAEGAAGRYATGYGVGAGQAGAAGIGPNLEGAMQRNDGDLEESTEEALARTGVESSIVGLGTGAAGFPLGKSTLSNMGRQAALQGTTEGGSVAAGAAAVGEEASPAEVILSGGVGGLMAPADVLLTRYLADTEGVSVEEAQVRANQMDPEQLRQTLEAAQRDGYPVQEAIEESRGIRRRDPDETEEQRQAREAEERKTRRKELAEALSTPQVYRREDVVPNESERRVEVADDAAPVVAPERGHPTSAEETELFRRVRRAEEETGVDLPQNREDAAVRDLARAGGDEDPGDAARRIVREYDPRRQEQAITESLWRTHQAGQDREQGQAQGRTYRPADRPVDEAADGRPVLIQDPRRDRRGRLVDGRQVRPTQDENGQARILQRDENSVPEVEVEDVGTGRVEFIPLDRVEQVHHPDAPRQEQDVRTRLRERPRGVGSELRDPDPATDRISELLGRNDGRPDPNAGRFDNDPGPARSGTVEPGPTPDSGGGRTAEPQPPSRGGGRLARGELEQDRARLPDDNAPGGDRGEPEPLPEPPRRLESDPDGEPIRTEPDTDTRDDLPAPPTSQQEPQDVLRAMGLPVRKGKKDQQGRVQRANAAVEQIDAGDLGRADKKTLADLGRSLGVSTSGNKADIRSRLESWRRSNTNEDIARKAEIARQRRQGELSTRDAWDQGLIERYPEVFPRERQLLEGTQRGDGRPDWQRTIREWAETMGNDPEESFEAQRAMAASGRPGAHRRRVDQAIEAGLDVPENVRRDYDDLPSAEDVRRRQQESNRQAEAERSQRVSDTRRQAAQTARRWSDELSQESGQGERAQAAREAADAVEAGENPPMGGPSKMFAEAVKEVEGNTADPRNVQLGSNRRSGGRGQRAPEGQQQQPDSQEARDAETLDRAQSDEAVRNGGVLYSGVPLNEIAGAVGRQLKRAWGGDSREHARWIAMLGRAADRIKEARNAGPKEDVAPGPDSSANPLRRGSLIREWSQALVGSTDGQMRVIADRSDSGVVRAIADALHAKAGDDQGVGRTFSERHSQEINRKADTVQEITDYLDEHKLTKREDHNRIIELVENPDLPRKGAVGEAARRIERFFADELEYQRKAGVNIGEVDGYFTRAIDRDKITGWGQAGKRKEDKFLRQAAKAYQEVGYDPEQARQAAAQLHRKLVYGETEMKPGQEQHIHGIPAQQVQPRKFTKAAAKHLSDFRDTNIQRVLSRYAFNSAKRAEIARTELELPDGERITFGDRWENWPEIARRMEQDGVPAEDIGMVQTLVSVETGVQNSDVSTSAMWASTTARNMTAMMLLDRVALSATPELTTGALRGMTGNPLEDVSSVITGTAGHVGNAVRKSFNTLTGSDLKNRKLEHAYEVAEDMGIIAGDALSYIMQARFIGDDASGQVQQQLMQRFFRNVGLTQLNDYSRVQAFRHGHTFLRRMAKDQLKGGQKRNKSGFMLRELGIPKGKERGFAEWMQRHGFDEHLPGMDELKAMSGADREYAEQFRTALGRFVDQSIMRPDATTRPKWASHPAGAVIFSLLNFTWAFQKNVLNRWGRISAGMGDEGLSALERASMLPGFFAAAGTMYASAYAANMVRDELNQLGSDEPETPATELYEHERAFTYSGFTGKFDPLLQILGGVRYQRSPAETAAGPFIGTAVGSLETFTRLKMMNTETTNTAERNAVEELHKLIVTPALQAGLALGPPAGLGGAAVKAAAIGGVRSTREPMVEGIAGPEDPSVTQRRMRQGRTGTLENLFVDEPDVPTPPEWRSGDDDDGLFGGTGSQKGLWEESGESEELWGD